MTQPDLGGGSEGGQWKSKARSRAQCLNQWCLHNETPIKTLVRSRQVGASHVLILRCRGRMETPHLGTPPTLLFASLLLAGPHTGGSAALIKTPELGVNCGLGRACGVRTRTAPP